ncbi:uncharacterized protein LOC122497846 [Leptopilina heterotoma]|uniref:uncharacterized protein LOC122497846 n=1 Tax=Leptopilina heterotoma TaxID=63436 RepID=UPI001CAA138A|nr:uncharacterized protein LOC122497846 [Leptopilina heterotoma]
MLLKLIVCLELAMVSDVISSEQMKITDDKKWMQSLTESVQKDQIHQVIIFINETKVTKNQIVENLIKTLSKNTPVIEIITPNYEIPTEFDFIRYNPRVSLFILSNSESDLQLVRTIDFLTKLSEAKRRPKCLLVLFHKLVNYQKFFEELWHRQFLDITLINFGQKITKNTLHLYKIYYPNSRILQYNPFIKLITNETISSKIVWFPDKLRNMHGYQLKAILLHAPPDVFEPENKSEEIYGLGTMKIKTWEKVLNFKMVRSSLRDWGKFGCSVEDSTGVCLTMYTNEAQILGAEAPVALCDGKPTELGKSVQASKIGMLVPLVKKDIEIDILQWQIKNIFIVMILPLFFWIISKLLNFSSSKWRMEYMFRITLGNYIPEEPENEVERIIFCAFLIGCFMFSSEIYTAINQVQLKATSAFKFETLEDVIDSNAQIFIDENYFFMLNTTDDVVLQQILKKTTYMTFSQDDCVERLLEYKNLTCILEIPRAEWQLRSRRDECGRPLVKFLLDKFSFDAGATQLGAGVPYAERFDQVIQRVIDSGIRNKWLEPYTAVKVSLAQVEKSCHDDEMESVMTMRQILVVLASGFGSSIVAFIFEFIVHRASEYKGKVFRRYYE